MDRKTHCEGFQMSDDNGQEPSPEELALVRKESDYDATVDANQESVSS